MRYRVRTPEGELGYESLGHLAQAYALGLVAPEDEVQEAGSTSWRKAATLPALARTKPQERGLSGRAQALSVAVLAGVGMGALVLLTQDTGRTRLVGLVLALVVSTVLSRVTYKAFRKPPHRG